MRPETKKQIREAVLYDMAPAQAGQVNLEDVARVFRGRGELREVEECLDELVKEGLAKRTRLSGRSYYIFESIAGEAAARNERRLKEIEERTGFLLKETERLEGLLKEENLALDRLRPIWLSGWEKSKLGPEEILNVRTYVSTVIGKHPETHHRELRKLGANMRELEEEKQRRLKWKEESFIQVPASK